MAKLVVICPVWNGKQWTEQFIASMRRLYEHDADVLLVIVDNASTDGTRGLLLDDEWIHVIDNDRNLGYAAACNQGAAFARDEFGESVQLVFINNDVSITGDFLVILRWAMGQAPNTLYGAVLYRHGTGWNQFNGEIINYLEGWLLAMTWAAYDGVGGFDEQFSPCDYEDVDLSYKATIMGRRLQALKLPVKHIGNQTGRALPDRLAITNTNKSKFARKWGFEWTG